MAVASIRSSCHICVHIYIYLCVCLYDVDSYVAFSSIYMHVSLFIYIYHIAKITSECVSLWVRVCVCLCECVVVCALLSSPPLRCPSHTHPSKRRRSSLKKCPQLNMDNWYYNFPDKHLVYIMYDPYTHTHLDRDIRSVLVIAPRRPIHGQLSKRAKLMPYLTRSFPYDEVDKALRVVGMCISAWKPIPKGI